MKIAVQIGAGNIGRGFLGQIFHDSGYRIVFIDVNRELVQLLNNKGKYQIEQPYCKLPVDKEGFIGEIPDLKYLEPYSPFLYIIQKKLYIHNAGHSIFAYLGYVLGKSFIWEAIADESIREIALYTLNQIAEGLAREHKVKVIEILDHIQDLLFRFTNRALGDTTERVGRDPRRKLGPEDRIIGAFRLLSKYDLDTSTIPLVIAAALHFNPSGDEGADWIQKLISIAGVAGVIQQMCGLEPDEANRLIPDITNYYNLLADSPGEVYAGICRGIKKIRNGY